MVPWPSKNTVLPSKHHRMPDFAKGMHAVNARQGRGGARRFERYRILEPVCNRPRIIVSLGIVWPHFASDARSLTWRDFNSRTYNCGKLLGTFGAKSRLERREREEDMHPKIRPFPPCRLPCASSIQQRPPPRPILWLKELWLDVFVFNVLPLNARAVPVRHFVIM